MKQILSLFVSLACLLLWTGCEKKTTEPPAVVPEEPSGAIENSTRIDLCIVDGAETGSLVLAGSNAGDVYTLGVGDIPIYLDGKPADSSALEDGMNAQITFSGGIMESWPARLGGVESISVSSRGTKGNPAGGYYDLSGLYLQVLEDLWSVDSALNESVDYINLDLSQAPGDLTDGERSAIGWIFAGKHQAEILNLTHKELVEQGYVKEGEGWENGVAFTITIHEGGQPEIFSLPAIRFDAMKWRSPLGAYFFDDCTAVWPENGTWSEYSIGAEAIS